MQIEIFSAFFAYFIILLIIGVTVHKKQKSSKEFMMGGRSLTYWVTAFSAQASDMSSWLFMAFPAAFFVQGLSQAWIGVGLTICMFLNWHLVSKKLRVSTEELDSYTLSTFFEKRFNDTTGIVRIVTAAMALIFMTCYLAAGLIAMGFLMNSLFGIDYYLGLTVATGVVVVYTVIGGYYTVAHMDQFQAIFLLAMIILVPCVAFTHLPEGRATITSIAAQQNISLNFFPGSFEEVILILFASLGWGLGYFGQPHIITKFMGIKCPNELIKAKYLGITWQILSLIAAGAVGIVGIGFFSGFLNRPELVFVEMVKALFHPFFGGFILCGLLAASMSTMDSQVLVCASILSEDFYKRMFKKHATQKELLLVSRLGVLAISLVSLGIAFQQDTTVMDAVFYAWTGLGCSFGPLVLSALYAKRVNHYGAIAGIVTGGLVAGLWFVFAPYISEDIPAMLPGFFASLASIFIVSRLTGNFFATKIS